MITRPECPDLDRLRSLVEGTLPAADQHALTEHLDTCEDCQRSLETLAAPAESWAAARLSGNAPRPPEPPLAQLLEKCQSDSGPNSDETSGAELPVDFLDPPERPDTLGRLDSYDILEVTGRGGMGIVLKAFDRTLHRVVAIKVLAPQLAASASGRKRFIREAQAAAAVRDQHVVDIHAVGEAKGLPYLVMEFISGISLQTKIDRNAPLPVPEVLRIGIQTAAGLAAAHAQGLIHRDIKPANILLENGVERVKITDFGLARVVDDSSLTASGVVAGTPQYMAPEQARGEAVDHRADLFSLGSVLYTLCTGHPPFQAAGNMAALKRVCDDTPRAIRELNPEVPGWLAAVVEKLHAKDPAHRYQSAREVAEQLASGLAHLQAPTQTPAPTAPAPRRTDLGGRKRRWAIPVVLILALGICTYLFGAAAYRFLIGKGRLEVQTDDPYVTLVVKRADQPSANMELHGDTVVDLDAGEYTLALTDGRADLRLSATRVTVGRGDRQAVRVTEDPDFVGEVRRFEGHDLMVRGIAFSPDGQWALSASHDKTLRRWDLRTGREVLPRFVGHTNQVTCVAVSADGSRALSGSDDHTVRLWDITTGESLHEFRGHTAYVVGVAFLPNGKQAISASYDRTLRLWDLETRKQVGEFRGHKDAVWSVAVTRDGKHAVSGSWDGTARVWDIETAEELEPRRFTRHDSRVWKVAVSPDGRLAASGGNDAKVRVWEVETGNERRVLSCDLGHKVDGVAFSPDSRQLLSISELSIRLWDVETGRQQRQFDTKWNGCIAFSPDGRFALSGGGEDSLPKAENVVRLWRLPPAGSSP
jgi:anti-sigma factor RsiW